MLTVLTIAGFVVGGLLGWLLYDSRPTRRWW